MHLVWFEPPRAIVLWNPRSTRIHRASWSGWTINWPDEGAKLLDRSNRVDQMDQAGRSSNLKMTARQQTSSQSWSVDPRNAKTARQQTSSQRRLTRATLSDGGEGPCSTRPKEDPIQRHRWLQAFHAHVNRSKLGAHNIFENYPSNLTRMRERLEGIPWVLHRVRGKFAISIIVSPLLRYSAPINCMLQVSVVSRGGLDPLTAAAASAPRLLLLDSRRSCKP